MKKVLIPVVLLGAFVLLALSSTSVSGLVPENIPFWTYTTGDDVNSVAISSSGSYIVAGSSDNTVYLFSNKNSTPIWTYETSGAVNAVVISDNGYYIVAGSSDNTVYLFTNVDNTPVWEYATGDDVSCVAIADNEVVAGSKDNNVYMFGISDNTVVWSYDTGDRVVSVSISSDGSYVSVGSWDGGFLFTNVDNSYIWHHWDGTSNYHVTSISDDGSYVAFGVNGPTIYLYLFGSIDNTLIWSYSGSMSAGTIVISSDGNYIVGGMEYFTYLFSKDDNNPLWSVHLVSNLSRGASITPDGSYFTVGAPAVPPTGNSETVYLFSKNENIPVWKYDTGGDIYTTAISSDGSYIAVGSWDDKVYQFGREGSGTPGDPYIITNIEQLQGMKDNLTAHYILGNDIAASDTANWNDNGTGGYYGFEPIGTNANKFTGSLDGVRYKIRDLYINRPNNTYVGLFGCIGSEAMVENVGLENENVNGNLHVGGLIGYNSGNATVSNCYSTGSVTGNSTVGGLVGYNQGTVDNTYSTCSVNGNIFIGGLVGHIETYGAAPPYYCGVVYNSYATGSVSGENYVGGLVGRNRFKLENSYATGTVTGNRIVGGLVGYNVLDAYAAGVVRNSYSTGSVNGSSDVGGLIGVNEYSVSSSFWDNETSGQTTSGGGTGKTTDNMKNVRTFTDTVWSAGLSTPWDFVGNPYDDMGDENTWNIDYDNTINNGYPFLVMIEGITTPLYNLPPTAPKNLEVESQISPQQLTTLAPEFSFLYTDNDDDNMKAFQIQVGTSARDNSLWDNITTENDDNGSTITITYAGSVLSRGVTYWWRVKAQDNENEWSDWSGNENFKLNNLPEIESVTVSENILDNVIDWAPSDIYDSARIVIQVKDKDTWNDIDEVRIWIRDNADIIVIDNVLVADNTVVDENTLDFTYDYDPSTFGTFEIHVMVYDGYENDNSDWDNYFTVDDIQIPTLTIPRSVYTEGEVIAIQCLVVKASDNTLVLENAFVAITLVSALGENVRLLTGLTDSAGELSVYAVMAEVTLGYYSVVVTARTSDNLLDGIRIDINKFQVIATEALTIVTATPTDVKITGLIRSRSSSEERTIVRVTLYDESGAEVLVTPLQSSVIVIGTITPQQEPFELEYGVTLVEGTYFYSVELYNEDLSLLHHRLYSEIRLTVAVTLTDIGDWVAIDTIEARDGVFDVILYRESIVTNAETIDKSNFLFREAMSAPPGSTVLIKVTGLPTTILTVDQYGTITKYFDVPASTTLRIEMEVTITSAVKIEALGETEVVAAVPRMVKEYEYKITNLTSTIFRDLELTFPVSNVVSVVNEDGEPIVKFWETDSTTIEIPLLEAYAETTLTLSAEAIPDIDNALQRLITWTFWGIPAMAYLLGAGVFTVFLTRSKTGVIARVILLFVPLLIVLILLMLGVI